MVWSPKQLFSHPCSFLHPQGSGPLRVRKPPRQCAPPDTHQAVPSHLLCTVVCYSLLRSVPPKNLGNVPLSRPGSLPQAHRGSVPPTRNKTVSHRPILAVSHPQTKAVEHPPPRRYASHLTQVVTQPQTQTAFYSPSSFLLFPRTL
jgi:hypothetical protein